MLAAFEQLASGTANGGFPLSRIVCHMDWAAEGRSYVDNLVEFESRVNDVWRRHDDAVICVYDLAKFGGDTVVDMMRTHPMIIVGGMLQQNPFFMPPEEFLHELRERRASRIASPSTAPNLEWQPEHPAEEIKRLQRCINDLVSVFALPAIWTRRRPIPDCSHLARRAPGYAPPGSRLCAVERFRSRRAYRDGPGRSMVENWHPAAGDRRISRDWLGRTRKDGRRWYRILLATEIFRCVPCDWGCRAKSGSLSLGLSERTSRSRPRYSS